MAIRFLVITGFAVALLAMRVPLASAAPDEPLITQSYPVADLVIPFAREVGIAANKDDKSGKAGNPEKAEATVEDRLLKLLIATVDSPSWKENGGRGTADYYPVGMTLVVNQTAAVHQKIAALLADLRKVQDVEVALEIRFVTVSDSFAERVGVDFTLNAENGANKRETVQSLGPQDMTGKTFLSEIQVFKFLEAAQGDRRTNVMQAPKLTLANGQSATLTVQDRTFYVTGFDVVQNPDGVTTRPKNEPFDLGLRLTAQAVVAPDRTHVQLYLKVEESALASPVVPFFPVTVPVEAARTKGATLAQFVQQPNVSTRTIEKTVAIPDGQTLLFGGTKRTVEARNEFGPPILSKIPYVNRWARRDVVYSRDSESELILVTPRIVVLKEQPEARGEVARRGYDQVQTLCPGTGFARLAEQSMKQQSVPAKPATSAAGQGPPAASDTARRHAETLDVLSRAYLGAKAEGRTDEAERLRRAMLAIDPNWAPAPR
jgi:type II secretory pathway component GspD/PulD (secretin)